VARAFFNLPLFLGNCFGLLATALLKFRIVGVKAGESSPPFLASVFATSRWNLTSHGRPPSPAVAFDVPPGGLIDCVEEGVGVDELVVAGSCAAAELSIIRVIDSGCWLNEGVSWRSEGRGESIHDVDPNITDGALDPWNGGTPNPGTLGEFFLRKSGFCPSHDKVNTKVLQRGRAGVMGGFHV
jgi:hypothetical protein